MENVPASASQIHSQHLHIILRQLTINHSAKHGQFVADVRRPATPTEALRLAQPSTVPRIASLASAAGGRFQRGRRGAMKSILYGKG